MTAPMVNVVLPVYNAGIVLRQALASNSLHSTGDYLIRSTRVSPRLHSDSDPCAAESR
jgi:hypothetical protein